MDLRDGEKATALYAAADGGSSVAVRMLLEVGADPNLPDRYGRTPLHAAAIAGHPLICGTLLEAGADPKATTRFPIGRLRAKSTPAEAAKVAEHAQVEALLANALAAEAEAPTRDWPDDGAVLRAWTEFPALYEGVTSPWYPEDTDLKGLLASALARDRRAAKPFVE